MTHGMARFDSRFGFSGVARCRCRFCNRAVLNGRAPLRVEVCKQRRFVAWAHRRRCAQNSDRRELELPDERLARHTFLSIELGKGSDLKYARCCGDLAQDLLASLIARVPTAWRQISTDGSEHSIQLHDSVLIDTNVFGNSDALPLGLLVLGIDDVHRRTASRPDVVKRQRPVSEEPEAWVSERT
jgi:hypothetical protein